VLEAGAKLRVQLAEPGLREHALLLALQPLLALS